MVYNASWEELREESEGIRIKTHCLKFSRD